MAATTTAVAKAKTGEKLHTAAFLRAQAASRTAWGEFKTNHARMLDGAIRDGEYLSDVKNLLPAWMSWTAWLQQEGRDKGTADNHVNAFKVWERLSKFLTTAEAATVRYGGVQQMKEALDRKEREVAKQQAEAKRAAEEAEKVATMTAEERAAYDAQKRQDEADRQREAQDELKREVERLRQEAEEAAEGGDIGGAVAVEDLPDPVVTPTSEGEAVGEEELVELLLAFEAKFRAKQVDRLFVKRGSPFMLKAVRRDVWVQVED